MKTFAEVWEAVDAGKTVYWKNQEYKVYVEPFHRMHKPEDQRDGKAMAVRCIVNYFGGFLTSAQIPDLFTLED